MQNQYNPVVHTTWSQILPSLNGLYDAQLDPFFDLPPPSVPTSSAPEAPRAHPPTQANYTWAQLLPSTSEENEEEDYDVRFAAEEEELTRAGIIRPPQSQHLPDGAAEMLAAQIVSASTPAAALAGQIAWYAASDGGAGCGTGTGRCVGGGVGEQEQPQGGNEGEDVWAESVRGARTPRGCLEAQVRWCEAKGRREG
ncbi:hypothetical protein K505DRAFT_323380 [Melanomma pulvis-pyrius CBS 109.77]|uniref:Uncharacterized protein n=1 Tax=Melanomma pulvis-pyrius CBS 109.77 TaxID=1314802 RepID=A0A6A6XIW3_9PLEO|nr:hypothetical protein K505DRAFT_323380 [Melanomma pulvis-pyrius CBS 109.77]